MLYSPCRNKAQWEIWFRKRPPLNVRRYRGIYDGYGPPGSNARPPVLNPISCLFRNYSICRRACRAARTTPSSASSHFDNPRKRRGVASRRSGTDGPIRLPRAPQSRTFVDSVSFLHWLLTRLRMHYGARSRCLPLLTSYCIEPQRLLCNLMPMRLGTLLKMFKHRHVSKNISITNIILGRNALHFGLHPSKRSSQPLTPSLCQKYGHLELRVPPFGIDAVR